MYVELPEVGSKVEKSSSFGVVESVKAASDVYSPVSGEVIEVNESLADTPGAVNEAAFSDGWLMKVRMSDKSELDSMMDAKEYEASWYASSRLGSTRLETRPRSSLDFHFARRPLTGFDRRRFARQPINARARTLQTIHSTSSYDPLLCLILSSSINPLSVKSERARAFAHFRSVLTPRRDANVARARGRGRRFRTKRCERRTVTNRHPLARVVATVDNATTTTQTPLPIERPHPLNEETFSSRRRPRARATRAVGRRAPGIESVRSSTRRRIGRGRTGVTIGWRMSCKRSLREIPCSPFRRRGRSSSSVCEARLGMNRGIRSCITRRNGWRSRERGKRRTKGEGGSVRVERDADERGGDRRADF